MQPARWKLILVLIATLLGIAYTLPNVLPASVRSHMPAWASKTLNLGLDLQGGSYLLYEIDTQQLAVDRLNNLVEDVRTSLSSEDPVPFSQLGIVGDRVVVTVSDPAKYDEAYRRLQGLSRGVAGSAPDITVTREPPQRIVLYRSAEAMRGEVSRAVEQNRQSILRRIDALGTREPIVTRQGSNRISIQAAGEANPERLKDIIGQTANLTFQLVDTTIAPAEAAAGIVPPGSEVLPMENGGAPVVVRKRVLVKGDMLTDAQQTFDENGRPAVSFRLNSAGASAFGRVTSQNIGKPFAIILDKKVISAPTIQSAITGGNGIITGSFTVQEANDLAIVLRSGALAAPMKIVQQGQVGAELGAEAVKAGQVSTVVGFIAIVVFMVLAYGFVFGGISVLCLVLNLLLIIAFMSMTQSTLSLPGIAGLILTLAVAVDANVLIYERVRDEERGGARPIVALETGFKRASVSIVDANVTTLIAAFIMGIWGSGGIKGFALMLAVGIFAALFTALIVNPVLIGLWFHARRPKQLPI
jgi:preprotein translocase subunit SecD